LKSKDLREKSPYTPNLANVKPTKDTSVVPQWKRELKENNLIISTRIITL
jgi:3-methyladenine DNA glycosylase AlkC